MATATLIPPLAEDISISRPSAERRPQGALAPVKDRDQSAIDRGDRVTETMGTSGPPSAPESTATASPRRKLARPRIGFDSQDVWIGTVIVVADGVARADMSPQSRGGDEEIWEIELDHFTMSQQIYLSPGARFVWAFGTDYDIADGARIGKSIKVQVFRPRSITDQDRESAATYGKEIAKRFQSLFDDGTPDLAG